MIDIKMQKQQDTKLSPKITVVGVGGAGCNAVNNMIATQLEGVDFIACNSDAQSLEGSLAPTKIQLGVNITGGLGAGANPEIGRASAEETIEEVTSHLEGVNMVFVTAGMGGGTGTGGAPVIAKAARDQGILTVGVITKPFHFEGAHRMRAAEEGIKEMQQYVDTLIVIPNQNLFRVANEKTTFAEAFKMADTVLQSGVRGVTDLMVMPGLINLDFADVRAVMLEMGKAMMGSGEAEGERRAVEAAEKAINNPLLDDVSMKGAHGVIINISGGYDMTLFEVDEACNRVRDEVDPEANIIFGSTFDDSLEGQIRVSIVATGIESETAAKTKPPQGFVYTNSNSTTQNASSRVAPKFSDGNQAVAQGTTQVTAPVAPETATGEKQEQEGNNEGALLGQRFGTSYIPPKAAEPSSVASNSIKGITYPNESQSSDVKTESEQGVTQASVTESVQTSLEMPGVEQKQGEAVQQPQPQQTQQQEAPKDKKRPPSLFERFTGGGQKEEKPQQTAPTSAGASDEESLPPFSQLRAQKPAAQGNLSIDTPAPAKATSQSTDEDLDIPAFLRRQAN